MFASIKIGILVAIIAGVGFGYQYITNLQNKLQSITENLATSTLNQSILEKEITAQKLVIDQQIKDFKTISNAKNKLANQNKELQKDFANLDKKFNKINASGQKRDIGSLAVSRSKTIEKIINRASDNSIRCLEIASGSQLTDKEKNATKKSQTNPECTRIANPNYIPY